MVYLKECKSKLAEFKSQVGDKFGIIRLGIFGSVAREENNENSNIEIVVEVKKHSMTIMYELEQSLKALFGCDVDLVRYRQSLRPLFKSNIQKDVVFV